MNEQKAAIDLGSGKIAIAVGEQTPNGIRIVSYNEAPSAGIKSGEIQNDSRVEQILTELLRKAKDDTGWEIDCASITLGCKSFHCNDVRNVTTRKTPYIRIREEEIDALTDERYAEPAENGETVFEVAPQSYCVNDSIGQTREDIVGMESSTIETEFLIVSGNPESLNKRRNILKNCGVKLEKAILSPIASARAVLKGPEIENGVALVDIGSGTTEISIFRDNILRDAAVIPFAGQSITNDIKEETSTSIKWAEKVKQEYGCCCEEYVPENKKLVLLGQDGSQEGEIDMTLLSRVIEARLSEILESVRYFIDNSKYSSRIPAGVVITGGTCYTENITQLAKAILGRKVRLAAPLSSIKEDSKDGAFDAGSSAVIGVMLESFSPMLSHCSKDNLPVSKSSGKEAGKEIGLNDLFGAITPDEKPDVKPAKQPKLPKEPKKAKEKKDVKGNSLWDKLFGPANDNA